jgi:folate-binding protein YgfZ
MEPAYLDDRAIIAVSRPEAPEFLQAQETNDVAHGMAPGVGLYAALLTPQGKKLIDFFVTEGEGALLLDCPRASRDALQRKLKMYKLRAKVDVEARDQLGVYSNLKGHPANRQVAYADRAITFADPRLTEMGIRSIGAIAEMPAQLPGADSYHAMRLALGLPEARDFGSEKIFALDAGLEELHGVSFTKGCYIGQELTSRMKHRATARKRILTVTAQTDLPQTGALTRGGSEIGEILSSYGPRAFALVRLDRLAETQGDIRTAEIPVALTRPTWLV